MNNRNDMNSLTPHLTDLTHLTRLTPFNTWPASRPRILRQNITEHHLASVNITQHQSVSLLFFQSAPLNGRDQEWVMALVGTTSTSSPFLPAQPGTTWKSSLPGSFVPISGFLSPAWVIAGALLLVPASAFAAASPTFEKDIRPILKAH